MDPESLRYTIEHAGLASAGAGFLTGLFFSFNPVALAAIPVSLAYVTKARDARQAVLLGSMFILGLLVTHTLLGLIAGFGGEWVKALAGRSWGQSLGPLLIVLGLAWPGWIRLPLPTRGFRAKRANGMWSAFLLGIPFSVAVCPVCTPALVVMLGVTAGIGSPLLGVVLLTSFALGRAIPIGLGAWALGSLEHLKGLAKYQRAFDILGGIMFIASGLYMLNAVFFLIPALAE